MEQEVRRENRQNTNQFLLLLGVLIASFVMMIGFMLFVIIVLLGIRVFQNAKLGHTIALDHVPVETVVVESQAFGGYTVADFEAVIFAKADSEMNLVVYTQKLEESQTTTMNWSTGITESTSGFLPQNILDLINKNAETTQKITYHGTATYQVNLGNIRSNDISVDNDKKVVTITIPHTELRGVDIPADEIEYGDVESGFLAADEVMMTPEDSARLELAARTNMEAALAENEVQTQADKEAISAVTKLFENVITSVDDSYEVQILFRRDE